MLIASRLSEIAVTTSADMLEGCSGPEILLGIGISRLWSSTGILCDRLRTHRGIKQIWDFVSPQP